MIKRGLLCLLALTLYSSASAAQWEYGKLWIAHALDTPGNDGGIVAYWIEGRNVAASGDNFPDLLNNLHLSWDLKAISEPDADEMNVMELLGQRGWELAGYSKSAGAEGVVLETWYFKRQLAP